MTTDPGLHMQDLDPDAVRSALSSQCRVAVLCMHTSPLEQAGGGDAGGMNIYVRKVADELARRGVTCDIFTRRTSPDTPEVLDVAPGIRVIAVTAGPPRPIHKDRLPRMVKRFAAEVDVLSRALGGYDVIHAHYWLSGLAGSILKQMWGTPLVVTFHTLARVKDASRSGESPEPLFRKRGEDRVVAAADRIVAGTHIEQAELIELYGADPAKLRVAHPGVDLDIFTPRGRAESRRRFAFGDRPTVVFVGRLQPLKGPQVALQAMASLKRMVPDARLVIAGGESPRGRRGEQVRLALAARRLRLVRRVQFIDPLPHDELADLYRAADVVVIPSASESFGLVALEAAACGTPVVATNVGGLRRLVRDGETGYLVPRRAKAFAAALSRLLADRELRTRMGRAAVERAGRFPWSATADELLDTYGSVMPCPGFKRALAGSGAT